MRNDRITFVQFIWTMLICSIYSVVFTKCEPSGGNLIISGCIIFINLIIYYLYQDKPTKLTKAVLAVYFSYIILICSVRFTDYMSAELGYGPVWLIVIILLVFIFFCSLKGIEPIIRAGAIILPFLLGAVIYIAVCCFGFIKFDISLAVDTNMIFYLILLFPGACYIWMKDNIIPSKNYSKYISALILLGIIVLFMFLSDNRNGEFPYQRITEIAYIDVFRGADCMLLELFSVSGLFITAIPTVVMFNNSDNKYIHKGIYLSAIGILILISEYSIYVKSFVQNEFLVLGVFTVVLLTELIEIIKAFINLRGNKPVWMNKNS